uniref:Uncharacterized protein n=1 Tax=Candidatus Kentrum sp. DK TaxID=2126562 RepID=A0A450SF71_9GAMM|nr:MAG: hypothetical protein BECKDK2373C_GA0170839_10323 [Candidatus Kentron sp. DK]
MRFTYPPYADTFFIHWGDAAQYNRFWESREAPENNYAFLASYSLKIKAGSKKSFSANLCVLCASAVVIFPFLTAEALQYAEIRREEKKSKSEPQHTLAQRFGCGLGYAMYSVGTLFFFRFVSDSNIRAAVSSSEEELHTAQSTSMTINRLGPWAPSCMVCSISAVREGPVTK